MDKLKRLYIKIRDGIFDKRFAIPALVVVVGVLLIVIAPWSDIMQGIDKPDAVPDNTVETPEQAQGEGNEDEEEMSSRPTPLPELLEPTEDTGIYNPLTGRPVFVDNSKNRPWAVVIGNTPEAQPLWGISRADIILEYLVEGATRFMAIYQDVSTAGTIRGIRSFRTSSMELAAGFDAIHAHWGGRTYENETVHGNPVTSWGTFDAEAKGIGFRISTSVLNMALEHRGAATGEGLINGVPPTFRTEHEAGFVNSFSFVADGTPTGGKPATTASITYPFNVKTTRFTYNTDENVYYVEQYKNNLSDGIDEKDLSFTNVLVLQMDISSIQVNDSTKHMKIISTGEGTGYFICGGKYTDIKWSRSNTSAQFKFSLTDGMPLNFGVGKTFICIVGKNDTQIFE